MIDMINEVDGLIL